MPSPVLEIADLRVSVENTEILKGVDLSVRPGEIHALMGPNGSGKSTLANTLMGHPKYVVTQGEVLFEDKSILKLPPDERARRGIFLAFQYPVGIPGVGLGNFLRSATKAVHPNGLTAMEFRKSFKQQLDLLKMDQSFAQRYVNEGFSGGEKKRAEVLQLAMLRPKLAILDETDSGLDIDALKTVAEGVNTISRNSPDMAVLIITHYQRILNYIRPDFVHVLIAGRVVESGGRELVAQLEAQGYEPIMRRLKQAELEAAKALGAPEAEPMLAERK